MVQGVRPGFPTEQLPSRSAGRAHVPRARSRREPLSRTACRSQPVGQDLRAGFPGARRRARGRSAGSVGAGRAGRNVDPAVSAAVHSLCRRPQSAAGPRCPLCGICPSGEGARRCRRPHEPGPSVFGVQRPLLDGDRRSLPDRRRRGRCHRASAIQWRVVRPGTDAATGTHQNRRRRHVRGSGDPVLRDDGAEPPLHQLPRPRRRAAWLDLRAFAGAGNRARGGRHCGAA